jgi:hypothetical protein
MHLDEAEWGNDVIDLVRGLADPRVGLISRQAPAGASSGRGLQCNPTTRLGGRSNGNADDQFLNQIYQASLKADLVIDVHFNRNSWSYPFMSETRWLYNPLCRAVAGRLGAKWVMIMKGKHPACFIHNCIGFDIGTSSDFLDGFAELLIRLADGKTPRERKMTPYKFAGDVFEEHAVPLGLKTEYAELERLPEELPRKLGSPSILFPLPVYAALWGPRIYPVPEFWGEVVYPYEAPVFRRRKATSWGEVCP